MAMGYSEKVMEHFAHPHNVGVLEDANGVGEVGIAKCGDIMKMYLKIEDGIIQDVKFQTFGCASAIATSSIATDLIKGQPIDEALKLTNQAVVEALDGLPTVSVIQLLTDQQAQMTAMIDLQTAMYSALGGIMQIPGMLEMMEITDTTDVVSMA